MRMVTALQFGHRSPFGKIQQNTSVAAMIRSTKIETKTIAKIAASDIARPLLLRYLSLRQARRRASHFAIRRGLAGACRRRSTQSEPLFHLRPGLDVRNSVLDAIDHDFGANVHRGAVHALCDCLVTLVANEVCNAS